MPDSPCTHIIQIFSALMEKRSLFVHSVTFFHIFVTTVENESDLSSERGLLYVV